MRRGIAVAPAAAIAVLVASACALAWRPGSPLVPRNGGHVSGGAPLFLGLLVAAFATYLAALLLARRAPPSAGTTIAIAVVIQLVPLGAPLLLSTDAWTYWAYGWIGGSGDGNPYADPPESFPANPALTFMGSAWRDTTTVYGPAFTMVSEPLAVTAADSAAATAWTYKTLAAAAALAAALLAGRLARRRVLAIALVGWNPLLAVHLAGGGHNDAWVGALLVAALALEAARRVQGAGVLWVLAIGVKWVPILFLGLRAVEARATGRPHGSRGLVFAGAAVVIGAVVLYGGAWPFAIVPLAGNAALETSYAIPHRLEQAGLPAWLALAAAAAVLLGGLAWLTREASLGRVRLGLAACLVLVTTPYLAVWYLAWALPLAAAEEDAAAIVACLALSAYLLPQAIPV